MRAAQLLCEGMDLPGALAQAWSEAAAQEELEELRWKEEQLTRSVQRVLMSWPDFEEEHVRAALKEACDDEDQAIDMLLGGYRAPLSAFAQSTPQKGTFSASKHEVASASPKEEFPALPARAVVPCARRSFTLGARSAWSRVRTVGGGHYRGSEDFPCLPPAVSKPLTRRKK